MQHDALIDRVQSRAKLATRSQAEQLTRATLETLAERVTGQLADRLAAQLPREIGENLRRTEDIGEQFDRQEFIRRVSGRAGLNEPQATYGSQVVFEVLWETTESDVLVKVRDALPDDLQALVDANNLGKRKT